MKVFGKKTGNPELSRKAALACIPVKSGEVAEERGESGDLLLIYPVRVRPVFAALGRFLGRSGGEPPKKRLQLDRLGTAAWDLFDGKRSVKRVIDDFAAAFDLHTREAEVSVTAFIRELGKRGLLGLSRRS